jgi:circadian clock protein KaiB
MKQYTLKLYVTGNSLHSQRAVANLHHLCTDILPGNYELSVVDVLADPDQAEQDRILATPTLIRVRPEPARRIIGDLSDTQRVMLALDLQPTK